MTNRTPFLPERETRKNQSEWMSSRRTGENTEDRQSPDFPVVRDICSPSDSTASTQYDGEGLDFGNAGVDFI